MSLGTYLKILRKEKGISQKILSEKTGISIAEISRIETGERQKPSPRILNDISKVLDISYEELIIKCGYINKNSSFFKDSKELEEKLTDVLSLKLLKNGWTIQICPHNFIGDILAIKDNIYWYINFKKFNPASKSNILLKEIIARYLGHVCVCEKKTVSKITIALCEKEVFESFKKININYISVEFSILLINLKDNCIIDEYTLKEKQASSK